MTPFALGTDGGGSVRIPGSLTGLFAVKAQFARVPVFPEAATPTLAHVGPMARTVRDAALLLRAVAGFDRRDPFAVAEPVPDFLAACDRPVKGMRIAWSPTLGYADPVSEVVELCEQAVRTLGQLGCEVEIVDEVMQGDPIDMWMSEFYAGVGTRLKTMFPSREDRLDPAVAGMLSGALDRTLEEYWTRVVAAEWTAPSGSPCPSPGALTMLRHQSSLGPTWLLGNPDEGQHGRGEVAAFAVGEAGVRGRRDRDRPGRHGGGGRLGEPVPHRAAQAPAFQ